MVVITSILIKGGSSWESFQCRACEHRWSSETGLFADRSEIDQADRPEASAGQTPVPRSTAK
jgi:hypothetical protein